MGIEEISNRSEFAKGMHDGIPIAVGYLVVSFSLGITAKTCGFGALEGFVASFTTYASAGEYIGFTLYAAKATLIQLIIMTVITNGRYLLMGFALNQRIPEETSLAKRLMLGLAITDEIFGITIARSGQINPFYPLGALTVALPFWSVGTSLGIVMGTVLPASAVSALSVALFGMFIAVIIPASRKDRIVAVVVAVSFAASYAAVKAPVISQLSSGNRTILLTLIISGAAAALFPVKGEKGTVGKPTEEVKASAQ